MSDVPFIDGLRAILAHEGSILVLRASLFALGVLAAFSWLRRHTLLAFGLVSAACLLGLGWWLAQIAFPLGLGTNSALSQEWAQAGVDALATADQSGFVWGVAREPSLVATLARVGTPLAVVHLLPQLGTFLGLVFVMLLPLALIKDPATARFAACVVGGGGLWPGVSPYGAILLHPSQLITACGTLAVILVLARRREVRMRFNHFRQGIILGLVATSALVLAWRGGVEAGATSAFLLIAASLVLASPVRAFMRRASASAGVARRKEAAFLLCAFCGSGLFWWDPLKSVPGFVQATDGSGALRKPLAWMAKNVAPGDVVLTSPSYSALVAGLAGRRVLFPPPAGEGGIPPLSEPFRRARLVESMTQGQPIARLAEAFSVTHLFLGPGEPSPALASGTDPGDEPRLSLVLVYEDAEDFRVFRLTKK